MKQLELDNILYKEEIKEDLYEEEFAHIFKLYYKRIYNYIYYRVNSEYVTEDLTSQVFEKVMINIDMYSENKSPFEVWIFAIARNIVNDYFRTVKNIKYFL
ncbi:sigma-70 region 2 family protein [Clostridium argentinense CDC 2741]|uniref:Sigma-70 region 2 family protein n=1 Tax=Clostridium argentinense CDC 2741 TaxID=1418104 RepID=A0A0C1QTJ0_9CLOT|nr:sigma factor [Clostridium argentinense]KIE44302.1 sigma-70 region 2 family protein [Clostridium argentinense CDC 2741]